MTREQNLQEAKLTLELLEAQQRRLQQTTVKLLGRRSLGLSATPEELERYIETLLDTAMDVTARDIQSMRDLIHTLDPEASE